MQRSTDTVPAQLTPKESVLTRNASELLGRDRIRELNDAGNALAHQGIDLPTLYAQQGEAEVPELLREPFPSDWAYEKKDEEWANMMEDLEQRMYKRGVPPLRFDEEHNPRAVPVFRDDYSVPVRHYHPEIDPGTYRIPAQYGNEDVNMYNPLDYRRGYQSGTDYVSPFGVPSPQRQDPAQLGMPGVAPHQGTFNQPSTFGTASGGSPGYAGIAFANPLDTNYLAPPVTPPQVPLPMQAQPGVLGQGIIGQPAANPLEQLTGRKFSDDWITGHSQFNQNWMKDASGGYMQRRGGDSMWGRQNPIHDAPGGVLGQPGDWRAPLARVGGPLRRPEQMGGMPTGVGSPFWRRTHPGYQAAGGGPGPGMQYGTEEVFHPHMYQEGTSDVPFALSPYNPAPIDLTAPTAPVSPVTAASKWTPQQQEIVDRIYSGREDFTFGPGSPHPSKEDLGTYVGGPRAPASGFQQERGVALAPSEYHLFTPEQRRELGIIDIAPKNQAGQIERWYGTPAAWAGGDGGYLASTSSRHAGPMQGSYATISDGQYSLDPQGDYAKAVAGTGAPSAFGKGVGQFGGALSSLASKGMSDADSAEKAAMSKALSILGGSGSNPYLSDPLSEYRQSLSGQTQFGG